jgi:hypothetical protein
VVTPLRCNRSSRRGSIRPAYLDRRRIEHFFRPLEQFLRPSGHFGVSLSETTNFSSATLSIVSLEPGYLVRVG